MISPNPTSDFFKISLPKPINEQLSLQIFSLDGKLVLQKEIQQGSSVFKINVNALLEGIHHVK